MDHFQNFVIALMMIGVLLFAAHLFFTWLDK